MKTIVINGKSITTKPINFEAICELEDMGFEVLSVRRRAFSSIRSAFAYHSGFSLDEASSQIEEHIKNGGRVEDFTPFLEAITESDFFKALTQKNEKTE